MRRKSIAATSQAFHEPMSTGGLLARSSGAWGPAQRLKCWSEDGNPASQGPESSAFRNHPPRKRIGGYGSRLAGSQPGPQGLWAGSPGGLGPGAFSPQKPPKPLKLRCFANLLVGAWRRRGCRLKRLLRRWGPRGKRSRDTPPNPPPTPSHVLGL